MVKRGSNAEFTSGDGVVQVEGKHEFPNRDFYHQMLILNG